MTTSTTVKYVMTNGLLVESEKYARPFLAKVCFAIQSDDTVRVTIESGNNGSQMKKLGTKVISRQELRDMPDDDFDNMKFNRAAFAMFGIEV